jgi:hypothetical protein
MNLVKAGLKLLGILCFAFMIANGFTSHVTATPKYAKDTGKKCLDCHKKIPKQGDKDVQLTELGQKFKDNDHKLPK